MKPTLRTWENEWVTASVRSERPAPAPDLYLFLSLPFTLGPPPTPTDDGAAAGSSIQVGEKFTSPQGCGTRGTRAGLRALVKPLRGPRCLRPLAGVGGAVGPPQKKREKGPGDWGPWCGPLAWSLLSISGETLSSMETPSVAAATLRVGMLPRRRLPTVVRGSDHQVAQTNPPVRGRVSADRSEEAAQPLTTPRLVRKSSTDDSVRLHCMWGL